MQVSFGDQTRCHLHFNVSNDLFTWSLRLESEPYLLILIEFVEDLTLSSVELTDLLMVNFGFFNWQECFSLKKINKDL